MIQNDRCGANRAVYLGILIYSGIWIFAQPGRTFRLGTYADWVADGSPWFWGTSPAADPTPRNPITLMLMTRDNADSVFVGRPCYYGLMKDRGCVSDLWTFSRYSSDFGLPARLNDDPGG